MTVRSFYLEIVMATKTTPVPAESYLLTLDGPDQDGDTGRTVPIGVFPTAKEALEYAAENDVTTWDEANDLDPVDRPDLADRINRGPADDNSPEDYQRVFGWSITKLVNGRPAGMARVEPYKAYKPGGPRRGETPIDTDPDNLNW